MFPGGLPRRAVSACNVAYVHGGTGNQVIDAAPPGLMTHIVVQCVYNVIQHRNFTKKLLRKPFNRQRHVF